MTESIPTLPVSDFAAKGWYAALSDAFHVMRQAGRPTCAAKIQEIQKHLSSLEAWTSPEQAIDDIQRMFQEHFDSTGRGEAYRQFSKIVAPLLKEEFKKRFTEEGSQLVISPREAELEAIVKQLAPAARDILWCALVWNDHNFDHATLVLHAQNAAASLGFPPGTLGSQVDAFNEWMARRLQMSVPNRREACKSCGRVHGRPYCCYCSFKATNACGYHPLQHPDVTGKCWIEPERKLKPKTENR